MRTCVMSGLCLLIALAFPAQATIVGVAGGPLEDPPATLGPYTLTPFPEDTREMKSIVTDAPSPIADPLGFDRPMRLVRREPGLGGPWGSYEYYDAIYTTWGAGHFETDHVNLTLPANTRAFYLFASSSFFSGRFIRVTADDGTFIRQYSFVGTAPNYYGFYQDDPDGPALRSLRISTELGGRGAYLFAGRFGIAIPEPATLGLLAAGLALLRRRAG